MTTKMTKDELVHVIRRLDAENKRLLRFKGDVRDLNDKLRECESEIKKRDAEMTLAKKEIHDLSLENDRIKGDLKKANAVDADDRVKRLKKYAADLMAENERLKNQGGE